MKNQNSMTNKVLTSTLERRTLMSKKVVAPPVPALTAGLVDADYVYITGQLAYNDSIKGVSKDASAAEQTEVVMQKIKALLESENLDFKDVLKVTIFITDLNDLFSINDIYTKYVMDPYPARSTIGVAFLALPHAKVEIEVLAKRKKN